MAVERITEQDLGALIEREMKRALDSGAGHVRNPQAFRAHLIDVGLRAERVAVRLGLRLPSCEAPDPLAALAAGAWHDGGKIRMGDDFHEISSALDIVEHGLDWGMLRGTIEEVEPLLRRAALAILPGFALYEQWDPAYQPTTSSRSAFEASFVRLGVSPQDLLPCSIDALVVMYCDMCGLDEQGAPQESFDDHFARRWQDVEERARRVDPGLLSVLPAVRGRVRAGCALVNRFLTTGFDAAILADFRAQFSGVVRLPGDRPGPAER